MSPFSGRWTAMRQMLAARVERVSGSLLGGIGVSGAPGPANDERCAQAGLASIAEDLEF